MVCDFWYVCVGVIEIYLVSVLERMLFKNKFEFFKDVYIYFEV